MPWDDYPACPGGMRCVALDLVDLQWCVDANDEARAGVFTRRRRQDPMRRGVPEVLFVPCRGEPFRAENEARPPVDVVVAWSFEAVLKSGAGSCAVGRCVCFEHEDQIRRSLQLLRVAAPR